MSRQSLQRLEDLAALILDGRLSALRHAARAKADSEERLAGLAAPPAPEGLSGAAGELAALNYQRWADARRAEINRVLARQTAELAEATDAARTAFGRRQALAGLVGKAEKPRR